MHGHNAATFYQQFANQPFYLYHIDGKAEEQHTISMYHAYKRSGAGAKRDSYPLFPIDSTDQSRPAFACKHQLELAYNSFPQIDSLLSPFALRHVLIIKLTEDLMRAFARLKGVPGLYFTTSYPPPNRLPWHHDRGIYMLLKSGQLVELWRYQL